MFKLEIKTGNAAYRSETETDRLGNYVLDPYASEVRRNLKDIIRQLEDGLTSGKIMDVNGNCAGQWRYDDGK